MISDPAPDGDATIVVFGPEDTTDRTVDRVSGVRLRRERVSADELAEHVRGFVGSMRTVLDGIPRFVGGFEIDQITLSAEISAKGKLSLLGSGGELGGKGGLTFTFRKVHGRTELAEFAPSDESPDGDANDGSADGGHAESDGT